MVRDLVCMWGGKLYFLQFVCLFFSPNFFVFLWWFGTWCVCGGACSAELCVPSSLQPPQCAGLNTQKTNSQHDSNRNTKQSCKYKVTKYTENWFTTTLMQLFLKVLQYDILSRKLWNTIVQLLIFLVIERGISLGLDIARVETSSHI